MAHEKPKVFIGSSVEGLDFAYAIQETLERDNLLDGLDDFDFGVFVFNPDDLVRIRGAERLKTRDNVVFELGLFVGRLGKERCFIVIPSENEDLELPTDLLGITPGTFEPDRQDKNLQAAVGPACNKVRKSMGKLGLVKKETEQPKLVDETEPIDYDGNDITAILQSWMGNRTNALNTSVIYFDKTDKALGLKPDSTRNFIEVAAKKWDYRVAKKGSKTILFERPPTTIRPQTGSFMSK